MLTKRINVFPQGRSVRSKKAGHFFCTIIDKEQRSLFCRHYVYNDIMEMISEPGVGVSGQKKDRNL